MSDKQNETIADIVAEMRKRMKSRYYPKVARNIMRQYADRIEAAWKRETQTYLDQIRDAMNLFGHEKFKAEHAPVGNAAAMREALVKIYHEVRSYCDDYGAGESHKSLVDRILDDPPDYTSYRDSILEIDRIVEAALSVPPRNCDVGTPEEQHCRFIEYCNECDCPMGCIHRKQFIGMLDTRVASMLKCYIRWSQMPYEAEEGGAK